VHPVSPASSQRSLNQPPKPTAVNGSPLLWTNHVFKPVVRLVEHLRNLCSGRPTKLASRKRTDTRGRG
jgi:hypothetical protein